MNTTLNEADFGDLSSDNPKAKYGLAKRLIELSKTEPAKLYPHFEYFVTLLKSDNNILKWTAIDIIGFLSRADDKGKIDSVLNRLIAFLKAEKLITANHAISALGTIAVARPSLQPKVAREFLKTERYRYETQECLNIVLGKTIETFGLFFGELKNKRAVVEFVRRQTKNSRAATRNKALKFLKRAAALNTKGE